MALSRKRVGLIVLIAAAALLGLVVMQVSLLRYAMEIKEQTFRNNVMTALGRLSQDLTMGEAVAVAVRAGEHPSIDRQMQVMAFVPDRAASYAYSYTDSETVDSAIGTGGLAKLPFTVSGGRVSYEVLSPQHVTLTVLSLPDRAETTLVDRFVDSGSYQIQVDPERFEKGGFVWRFQSDAGTRVLRVESGDSSTQIALTEENKQRLASDVLDRLLAAEFAPIRERLDSVDFDSILAVTLKQSGIDLTYAYGVRNPHNDSLYVTEPKGYEQELRRSDLQVRLFPEDLWAPPTYLALHFPDRRTYVWAQIMPLAGAEVLLMLIIIACFAYTIRTILRQRRLSRLLVDFINNMTHEFKTPISTVALATEAIARPDIVTQKDRVLQFNDMIRSEIGRMRNQAEKILQMASLEEGDIHLTRTGLDLHDLIREAVDAVSLQVEARGGVITTELARREANVEGDRVHLSNIIHNLLDNAMKYSPEAPRIAVQSEVGDREVRVCVQDHGLGISTEEQKHVFEKFYRVPTGNRHDVKGFGLGLSYVKLMVEAHGGEVKLKSAAGRGTTVEFRIPRCATGGAGA